MSTSSSSTSTSETKNYFPEQRVHTIADALGVYLTTSFCDSIVRHSGQTLEALAAQSRAMEAEKTTVSPNRKSSVVGEKSNKIYRSHTPQNGGWSHCRTTTSPLLLIRP